MAMTPKGWSISALAVELDRDRRTIAAAVARLKPAGRKGKASLYRLTDVVTALGGATPGPSDPRQRKLIAEADMAELDLAKARATMAPIEDTVRAITEVLTAVRAKLIGLPHKAAPTDPVLRGILTKIINEALHELVADGNARAASPGVAGDGGLDAHAADADDQRVGGHLSQAFL